MLVTVEERGNNPDSPNNPDNPDNPYLKDALSLVAGLTRAQAHNLRSRHNIHTSTQLAHSPAPQYGGGVRKGLTGPVLQRLQVSLP